MNACRVKNVGVNGDHSMLYFIHLMENAAG